MSTPEERVARREGVERDLLRYEERSRYLDQRVEAAKSALQKAQQDLALATKRAQYARIDCDLIRRHLAFDPDIFNGLPCELLQAIFVQSFDNTGWEDLGEMSYSRERSLVPYRLGAVCRHWRRVVQDTPELWTYIAMPPWSSRHRNHFADYVERHLSMSRSRALQLCLVHRDQNTGGDVQWFSETFATLSTHMRRCRTLKLVYPHDLQARIFKLLTENPPLLLEEVFLGHSTGHLETSVDAPWLSGAPHLRRLYTERIALRLTSALSSIQSASQWDISLDALADTFHQLPRLQSLTLRFFGAPSQTPSSPVVIPALQSLTVCGRSHCAFEVESVVTRLVVAPELRKLSLQLPEYNDRDESWGQHYVAAFPDITDLELVGDGRLRAGHAVTFGRLSRVRRLVFERCAFPQWFPQKGEVQSFWLSAAAGVRVWPELESLGISRYDSGDYSDKSDVLDDIRDFVLSRCPTSNGLGKRFSLSLARWPARTFPQELVRDLVRALGPGNVRLENQYGDVQSVSAADGR